MGEQIKMESMRLTSKQENDNPNGTIKFHQDHSYRRFPDKWRLVSIALGFLCFSLIIIVIVLSLKEPKRCKGLPSTGAMDLSEPENPSVFHDLTANEVNDVMDYIYNDRSLNLEKPSEARDGRSYLYSVDLHLPDKADVINYLDSPGNTQQPSRAAKVVIFRGDLATPVVEEYKISPLPNPESRVLIRTVPFQFRPVSRVENQEILQMLRSECDERARSLLFESFGGYVKNCGNRCLVFRQITPIGSAVTGSKDRKMWYSMSQFSEFYSLHPVGFSILVSSRRDNYTIQEVLYNRDYFDSLEDLAQSYNESRIVKLRIHFPIGNNAFFSQLRRRGAMYPEAAQRPPIQFEPDGKRYTILKQEVKYMQWSFHYRMSSTYGPQLYDIRYQDERIIYELGLQEIVVFYSNTKPSKMYGNYFHSSINLGEQMTGLVPGVDCPLYATLIDVSVVDQSSASLRVHKNAFCVFELNTGDPLRRHHSYTKDQGSFYEGAPNSILVLRTIATVENYDYIFDFVFYQNGVIKVKVVPAGFILPEFSSAMEYNDTHGFKVHDYIIGNIYHHSFNFKVDLDIKGSLNRYETIQVTNDEVPNPFSSVPVVNWQQEKIAKNLKTTEVKAAYKYNFDVPMYHVFHTNSVTDDYGNPKAYRILSRGMSKSILPEGKGIEPCASWMRYQLAVTKRKESERHSSSMYSSFDCANQTINFQSFLDDNDTIIDQDLVAWVTLGAHHIPHTENLPIIHTPAMELDFYLLPFNYFPEDPSMGSRDSVRIEPKYRINPGAGLNIEQHTVTDDVECLPERTYYFQDIQDTPQVILQT